MSDCALIGLVLLINLLAISFIFFSRHIELKHMNTNNKQYEICQSDPAQRTASMLHLSSLLLITGIPFAQVIVPTLLWLAKKNEHNFIDQHGREVINFQISLALIQLACAGIGLLMLYLVPGTFRHILLSAQHILSSLMTVLHLPINIFTVLPFTLGVIFIIKGAQSAYMGLIFKYPCSYPFIKMIDQHDKPDDFEHKDHAKKPQSTQINFGKFHM